MTAFKIGSVRGIPIRVHITFLLILPFLAWVFGNVLGMAAQAADVPASALTGPPWMWGLGLAVALFASVLLHELAHAVYAVRKGGVVKDIILMMIGGVSRLEKAPEKPRHEAIMAAAGPAMSLGIGGACLAAWALMADTGSFSLRFGVFYLGQLNIFLGLFNLLPAFPMDGGRIARSLLTGRFGRVRATHFAGTLGKGFAILFALLGLLSGNFILVLIAVFVFLGAEGERRSVVVEDALAGLRVKDLMSDPVTPVSPHATAEEIGRRMKFERRTTLPVGDGMGSIEGVVTLESVRRVHPTQRHEKRARELAIPVEPLAVDEEAWPALRKMYARRVSQLPVVENGLVVGMLRQADVSRAMELRELDSKGAARPRTGFGHREREA
jgi:Zn-dependent protease/predicted transcriptional regulator